MRQAKTMVEIGCTRCLPIGYLYLSLCSIIREAQYKIEPDRMSTIHVMSVNVMLVDNTHHILQSNCLPKHESRTLANIAIDPDIANAHIFNINKRMFAA